jgi:uncharacterized protein with ParB-like and HNH nuclease domain
MLNKSLIKARRPYEDRLEIITLCERLKSFYEKYKGTCESIVPGVETVWFDNPEYQRELVWTLNQKQDYVTNLFNGMAEIRPTILLYYEGKKDVYEVLDGKQRLTTLFQFIDNEFAIIVDGEEVYFNDLIETDKKFILNHNVYWTRIMSFKVLEPIALEDKLTLFLEKNYLGTRMSDEQINKVLNMLDDIKK